LIVNSIKHNFQKEIYELFEIPQNKFVHLETYPHIQSDRLVYFTPTYQPDMKALAWVRDTILNSIDKNVSTEKRIYISRQRSNSKRIKNHEEIIPLLEKFDFKIIKPEEMTLFEQVETFYNANFVIGAHGAALANLMFCKPDTNVIEIRSSLHQGSFSAPFVYMWYKELNNLKYSLLLSEIDESSELKGRSKMDSDLVIDIVELESLIKLHLD
jgi:capsular polysaccharide biosynthesis protein